jgi:hypothetical protein
MTRRDGPSFGECPDVRAVVDDLGPVELVAEELLDVGEGLG